MDTIIITFENGEKKEYRKGIKLKEIIEDIKDNYKYDIVGAICNNQYLGYEDTINKSGTLKLYDINTKLGNKIYERGLIFLFIVSAKAIIGKNKEIKIRHSLDKGIFCELEEEINEEIVKNIKKEMEENVNKAVPFTKIETSRIEAMNYFKKISRHDKAKTLFFNNNDYITLYKCNGMFNYIIGEMPADASILKHFDLTYLEGKGIVLRFPSVYDNSEVTKYKHHEKFFESVESYSEWAKILKINNLGELNEAIINSKPGEIINLCENIQDYRLLSIAEHVSLNKSDIKLILITGPSSSGKTTTSRKLSLYLKTLGLNPVPLSIDDYFVERKDTPLDEEGKPDYESIRSIDVKLFGEQIGKLLKGEKVKTPTFDFFEGKKVYKKELQLDNNDVLIIEGLHALNNELTSNIANKNKYKIYVSPLAFLNIDNDNRISLTDIRLLRRMVRDNRTRGYDPSTTLSTWHSVRKGEVKYVFPYQDEADVIFNSFLAYELGVLKTYCEPLLYSIKEDDPEYLAATRLIELLRFVIAIPSDDIPSDSILREFIGGSYFER